MIIAAKSRGFVCTTAHPVGCEENVKTASFYAKEHLETIMPKRVLVIGSSTGYGLATRIASTFGGNSDTVGVCLEHPPIGKRTASAGYYNNLAFEKLAKTQGCKFSSINGDAFSKEIKLQTIEDIRTTLDSKVDLVVYSLASPKRKDHNGILYNSVIKPINTEFVNKTVDFHTGEVSPVTLSPATTEEIENTVKVMGGEDWVLWIEALLHAGVLAENCSTIAFSYVGPEITHPIYKDGTIGEAKEDLDIKSAEINTLLQGLNGCSYVSVNKALVTQASSAIPVVPLYISLLYKVMKTQGTHENTIEQIVRLFQKLYGDTNGNPKHVATDKNNRIRMDDWEMDEIVQQEVNSLWEKVDTENIYSISDLKGYREEFFKLFGFEVMGVDYSQETSLEDYT